jgi:tetratricopeptide (TPR) repeat protein
LERALSLASEIDDRGAKVPMILDSLGELSMLRGDLEEAQSYLERAVTLATENGNKWYAGQALRTLGRCYLAIDDEAAALTRGKEALAIAEGIGDRQAVCESRLLVAEAHLRNNELKECSEQLQKVQAEVTDSTTDLGFAGEKRSDCWELWRWFRQTQPLRLNTSVAAYRSSTCWAIVTAPLGPTTNSVARTQSANRIAPPNNSHAQSTRSANWVPV